MDYRIKKAIDIIKRKDWPNLRDKFFSYLNYQSGIFYLPLTILKIKAFSSKYPLEEAVDFAFNGSSGIIKPQQIESEVMELIKHAQKMQPKTALEIGTAEGGTLFLLTRAAAPNATIISLDLPHGGFDQGSYPNWKIPLLRSFAREKQKIQLIRADSHQPQTLKQIQNILNGQDLDLLFIDGDHSYEGVKKDFEMYSPLVGNDGLIALHDIVPHPADTGCEVSKFWKELKVKHQYKEIIASRRQKWGGLGLIKR